MNVNDLPDRLKGEHPILEQALEEVRRLHTKPNPKPDFDVIEAYKAGLINLTEARRYLGITVPYKREFE